MSAGVPAPVSVSDAHDVQWINLSGVDFLLTNQPKARFSARSGAVSLLCVLLILFAAVAQSNHVHSGKSNSPDRDCSICSIAHSGAIVKTTFQPTPVFARSGLVICQKASPKSFLLVSFLYIRPPPVA